MGSTVTIRLRRAVAQAHLAFLREGGRGVGPVLSAFESALERRPAHRLVPGARQSRRVAKRAATTRIREAVFARAAGRCEGAGMGTMDPSGPHRCLARPAEMDHVFGRVRVRQAVSNCIALCRQCHLARTRNQPSAYVWWVWFEKHFRAHGYIVEARMAEAIVVKHDAKLAFAAGRRSLPAEVARA